jgi:hypothetical protein
LNSIQGDLKGLSYFLGKEILSVTGTLEQKLNLLGVEIGCHNSSEKNRAKLSTMIIRMPGTVIAAS